MFWQNNNVLVTGAGGFIGSHLVEALAGKKAKVRAFVHYNSRNDWGNLELLSNDVLEKIEIITGDIRDPFCVRNVVKGCDTVFHLGCAHSYPVFLSGSQGFRGYQYPGNSERDAGMQRRGCEEGGAYIHK